MPPTPFRTNEAAAYLTEGQTLDPRKRDRQFTRDHSDLKTPTMPALDSSFLQGKVEEVRNGIITKTAAETTIKNHHSELYDTHAQGVLMEPKAEINAQKSHLHNASVQEKEILERRESTQKVIKKRKSVYTSDMNPLEMAKMIALGIFALIATLFGIVNLSRILGANNVDYIDAPWWQILIVSLGFTIPIIAVKGIYDNIERKSIKEKFIKVLFIGTLASSLIYGICFCYVNMPRSAPQDLFAAEAMYSGPPQWVQFIFLASQICLEVFAATLLVLQATRIYESHVEKTDVNIVQKLTSEYKSIKKELDQVTQDKILINRRLEMLGMYFEKVALQKKNYLNKAITEFQTLLRRAS